jgi:outer membrane protein assembly factor BamD
MNQLSQKSAAAALAVLMMASVSALAREKAPKKKKNQDLSANPLANVSSRQPDKELFDKAMVALKKGRYDVARLDLQTMLNTYPDSEYRMRAKLAVGDTWFKGGSAALAQAEAEYKDFITFFPQAPEAAEAQMKVGDIYYQQMEKPDRDFNNALNAEREYRNMINMFPDSTLIPRAKQRLRDVQEVLAERETQIGIYYQSRENYAAAIARLDTVVNTYPLYSRSDLALLAIGDSYAGQAHAIQIAPGLPGALRERLRSMYLDKATMAYSKVVSRYPAAPHVEDARDRLVAMNRPIPEPTAAAMAENEAEEQSRQKVQFNDKMWGIIKHGPTVVEAAHVGEPSLDDPKRTLAPQITKENMAMYQAALNEGKPVEAAAPATPTGANEPPRSDQPSQAPLQMEAPASGTGVGVSIVGAPAAADPNAVVKPVGPTSDALPAAEPPAAAPEQINDIKPGSAPATTTATATDSKKKKAPKTDLDEESSSKKKKKKGLGKLNPF